MFKKLLTYALSAYLTFSPINVNAKECNPMYPIHNSYKSMCVENKKMHFYLLDSERHRIKVLSSPGNTLEQMIDRYETINRDQVVGGINGSYFNPKDYLPVGRVVSNGHLLKFTTKSNNIKKIKKNEVKFVPKFPDYDFKFRSAFYIDFDEKPHIGYVGKDLSNILHMVTAGPLLIKNGKHVLDESFEKEMFRDYYKQQHDRSVVIIKPNGEVMFMVAKDYRLEELSDFLYGAGVKDAMCLDSGSSSQLYENYLTHGNHRKISNSIIVVRR